MFLVKKDRVPLSTPDNKIVEFFCSDGFVCRTPEVSAIWEWQPDRQNLRFALK